MFRRFYRVVRLLLWQRNVQFNGIGATLAVTLGLPERHTQRNAMEKVTITSWLLRTN